MNACCRLTSWVPTVMPLILHLRALTDFHRRCAQYFPVMCAFGGAVIASCILAAVLAMFFTPQGSWIDTEPPLLALFSLLLLAHGPVFSTTGCRFDVRSSPFIGSLLAHAYRCAIAGRSRVSDVSAVSTAPSPCSTSESELHKPVRHGLGSAKAGWRPPAESSPVTRSREFDRLATSRSSCRKSVPLAGPFARSSRTSSY